MTVAPAEDTTVANAFVRIARNGVARLDVTCATLTLACTGGVVRITSGSAVIGSAAVPPIDGGGIASVTMPISAAARLRLQAHGALAVHAHVDVRGSRTTTPATRISCSSVAALAGSGPGRVPHGRPGGHHPSACTCPSRS